MFSPAILPWILAPLGFAAEDDNHALFESKIRPLLIQHCHSCHGEKETKGGLRLDARAYLLEGGDSGPAIVPGDPENSLLVDALRHGEIFQMPPTGPLPTAEVEEVVRWIAAGAPWPQSEPTVLRGRTAWAISDEDRAFWAFQPPVDRPAPEVTDANWPRTSIDSFLLARLEAEGLRPASEVDRWTWLRRVTWNLTGLPPTFAEMSAFLADAEPGAHERVVDRLLASEQYGVHWARHWLDAARYADSNGQDENLAFVHAYQYRDYVVRSLNQDKPFDHFIREQLAGDLLPTTDDEATRNDRLAALGFLTLGPKMLAEQDHEKMRLDIVDEQLDTLGKVFLGMTLGCARCHDHKFDPISARDYYAMAGILYSTRTMENFATVATWVEHPMDTPEYRAALAAHHARAEKLQRRIKRRQREILHSLVRAAKELLPEFADLRDPVVQPTAPTERYLAEGQVAELATLRKQWAEHLASPPTKPAAMGVDEGQAENLRIHIRGSHLNLGAEVPRGFPEILRRERSDLDIPENASGRLQLADWITSPDHPLVARVVVNRIWQGHFQEGIVRSLDNFGMLGDRPSHPELLDHLAIRFIQSGWSLKGLHRQIVLSSAYRMGSGMDHGCAPSLYEKDPENRLLGRFPRRRLRAEEIRDGMLFQAGTLDLSLGGTQFRAGPRAYVSRHHGEEDPKADRLRRTIYLPVVRCHPQDLLQAFDFPDPNVVAGKRVPTTIAPQGLYLMNSPLVREQARRLAGRISSRMGDIEALDPFVVAEEAFQAILAREPNERERELALSYLGSEPIPLAVVQNFCQAIWASIPFLYVE